MLGEYLTSGLSIVTPATNLPVSLDAARRNSRIDTTDEDQRLTELIRAATAYVQKHTDTALITQTLSWKLDQFPVQIKAIYLPIWPVQSLASISYTDVSEATVSMDLTTVATRIPTRGKARIARKKWLAWPSTLDTPDAVDIRFIAGFGSTEASVPEEFKQAILLLVSHWFENREAVLTGTASKEVEFAVSSIIDTIRDSDGWGADLR
jgi:uncharacterized phiE125 gp8 family phage protein